MRRQIEFRFHEVVNENQKIVACRVGQITGTRLPSPRRHEGRFAVVTKRGAGCDGPLAASGDGMIPEKWETGFPTRIMLKQSHRAKRSGGR